MATQRWAVGVGVLLALLVLVMVGRADEATAVKAIKELGGRIEVDQMIAGEPIVYVDLSDTKLTDAGLKVLTELTALRILALSGTKVTDAVITELKELKNLKYLDLTDIKVTDAGVQELEGALPALQIYR